MKFRRDTQFDIYTLWIRYGCVFVNLFLCVSCDCAFLLCSFGLHFTVQIVKFKSHHQLQGNKILGDAISVYAHE